MRQRRIFTFLLLLFVTAASAQAHTGDWKTVEHLRPGTLIFVEAGHGVRCVFVQATDKELICDPAGPSPVWLGQLRYRFERRIVREVRLEHSDTTNTLIGTAIGAGAGAALAAVGGGQGGGGRGGAAFVGALFGGILGAIAGRLHPITHGKVIYKQ